MKILIVSHYFYPENFKVNDIAFDFKKKGYDVTIFERESILGGRAQSLDMSRLNFEEYKKILSRFEMNISFSEPSLRTLFDKKMLDGYFLDLGYHVIGGGIIDKLKEVLSPSDEELDILESRLYEQKNDHYGYFVTNLTYLCEYVTF